MVAIRSPANHFPTNRRLLPACCSCLDCSASAGIGRIYLGHTGLGIAQLLVGWVTCGLGAVIWGVIDALLILTDKVGDPWGRPLRDGS